MVGIAKCRDRARKRGLRPVPKLKVAGVVLLLLLVFFLAPVVPYVNSVSILAAGQGGSADVWGLATPSYALLGYGSAPYSSMQLVTVGGHSALVFFHGGRAVAVEEVGGPGAVLNPSSVIGIQYAGVSSADWGTLNITLHLRNISYHNITDPVVYVSMEGFSSNGTAGGLPLIEPRAIGTCGAVWVASDYCDVSQIAPNNLPVNQSVTYYAEIRGTVAGSPFVYRQPFWEDYPRGGIGPLWVSAFMAKVDQARGGQALAENATLDAFAALRFKNATAHYQISDYNLSADAQAFFGPGTYANDISEVLLYPGVFSPNTYPSFLADYAVGHWDGLLNSLYTQYGYYVGEAPYYEVSVPCPVYEIPRAGMNITQFFAQHGCATSVATETWLVIIMGL